MTLNWPTPRSSKLHVKFVKMVTDTMTVSGSRIGDHPCTSDWHHELLPWMTLNCPRSRSGFFKTIYNDIE